MKDGYYWVKSYPYSKPEKALIKWGYAFFDDGTKQWLNDIFEICDYIETPDKYKDN